MCIFVFDVDFLENKRFFQNTEGETENIVAAGIYGLFAMHKYVSWFC